jgi:hypothetical protein
MNSLLLAIRWISYSNSPTREELVWVIRPPGLEIKYLTSKNELCNNLSRVGFVSNPENPDLLKYNKPEYIMTVKREAQKRQEIMKEIIKTNKLSVSSW